MKRRDFISLAISAMAGSQIPGWTRRQSGIVIPSQERILIPGSFPGPYWLEEAARISGRNDVRWRIECYDNESGHMILHSL